MKNLNSVPLNPQLNQNPRENRNCLTNEVKNFKAPSKKERIISNTSPTHLTIIHFLECRQNQKINDQIEAPRATIRILHVEAYLIA